MSNHRFTIAQVVFICFPQHLSFKLLLWVRLSEVLKWNIHPFMFTQQLFFFVQWKNAKENGQEAKTPCLWSNQWTCHLKICLRTEATSAKKITLPPTPTWSIKSVSNSERNDYSSLLSWCLMKEQCNIQIVRRVLHLM